MTTTAPRGTGPGLELPCAGSGDLVHWQEVQAAVINANYTALQAMAGRIDWDSIPQADTPYNSLMRTAPRLFEGHVAWSESMWESALVLMRQALAAMGRGGERVFALEAGSQTGCLVEPVETFIYVTFTEGLHMFLEAGFDPTKKYGSPARNAIQYAQDIGRDEIAAMLQAHAARAVARSVIALAKPGAGGPE